MTTGEAQAATSNPFQGTWTYRSFVNNPDASADFGSLRFGLGQLTIDDTAPGSFSGRLSFGATYQFKLTGSSTLGNPSSIRFQGVGDKTDSMNQVYDYIGYFVPIWPNGVDQVPAIVGSTVRTVEHDGQPAGVVASWIALKTV